jgi:acyl-CoA thioesterase-1
LVLATAPAVAEPVIIAALGDSLTQGFGLPPESGFVPQLESWLTAQGEEVILINAGVSGDTTAGGLARADWTLTPEVDALIVAFGGNDILRGISPEEARRNLSGILDVAAARDVPVLLVGMVAPPNYGPDYKEQFDAIYPDLAERFGTEYFPSFLGPILAIEDRQAALAQFMQRDGIHPNDVGVALIVEQMGPSVQALIARVR